MSTTTQADPMSSRADGGLSSRVFEIAGHVQDWANAHRDRVAVCYLVYSAGTLELVVTGTSGVFDFDLNSDLAKFTTDLVRLGFPVFGVLHTSVTGEAPRNFPQPIRIVPVG